MYVLASQFKNLPIISLQTGETVATLRQLVIEMSSLEIVAIACIPTKTYDEPLLMVRDIRQIATDCIIIDSEDDIGAAEDVVRLKETLSLNYSPIGANVISHMQRPIGKVEDFTTNSESLRIHKLYIRQPIWRSMLGSSLIIGRDQIIDVTPHKIVVREATVDSDIRIPKPARETNT